MRQGLWGQRCPHFLKQKLKTLTVIWKMASSPDLYLLVFVTEKLFLLCRLLIFVLQNQWQVGLKEILIFMVSQTQVVILQRADGHGRETKEWLTSLPQSPSYCHTKSRLQQATLEAEKPTRGWPWSTCKTMIACTMVGALETRRGRGTVHTLAGRTASRFALRNWRERVPLLLQPN